MLNDSVQKLTKFRLSSIWNAETNIITQKQRKNVTPEQSLKGTNQLQNQ